MFVYGIENAIPVKKRKFALENIQNNVFVIRTLYGKNVVSVCQNSTMLDLKK